MRYVSLLCIQLVLVTKPTCALAAGWGPHWTAPSSSLPLWSGDSWVSFTELSDGWHDHGKTPLNPPHCLQLEKQTERGTEKKEWSYFLLFVWFWNSRRVTVSGSSASTTTVYFQSMKLTTERKRGRKSEWDRRVYDHLCAVWSMLRLLIPFFLCCTISAALGTEKQSDNPFTVVTGTIYNNSK